MLTVMSMMMMLMMMKLVISNGQAESNSKERLISDPDDEGDDADYDESRGL